MKNVRLGKIFFEKEISKKKIAIFFQVDITSSDLNEFWIGQKILKAESLLLNLSTTFTGHSADILLQNGKNNLVKKKSP